MTIFKSAVVLCLATLAMAGCAPKKAAPQGPKGPPTVGIVTLRTQSVELSSELPGRTSAFETADVRPQVNGVIQKRLFVEGSIVRKGQPLYQIDPAPYRAALDQAQGAIGQCPGAGGDRTRPRPTATATSSRSTR